MAFLISTLSLDNKSDIRNYYISLNVAQFVLCRSGIPVHTGTRQTRLKARPAPDFTKLHNQWSEQCKQRKASKKPCTQVKLLDVLTVVPSDNVVSYCDVPQNVFITVGVKKLNVREPLNEMFVLCIRNHKVIIKCIHM